MHRRNFLQAGLLTATFSLPERYFSPAISPAGGATVFNAGIGGNNTVDLLQRMDKDCLSHQPDLTILMVGTNDMNSRKYIALPEFEANLRKIVGQLVAAKSRVLLMTILPVYEPYLFTRHPRAFYEPEGHAGRKKKVNDVIRKIAADYRQELLDMGFIFQQVGNVGEEEDSLIQNVRNSKEEDGVHPTPAGYRTMAVALYEYIIQRKLPHNRVVCFGDSITLGDGGMEGNSYPAYLKKLLPA